MTTAELKVLLSRPAQIEQEYRLARGKADAYRQLLTGRTVRYDITGSGEHRGNPFEKALCALADYETETDRLFAELVKARENTQRLIDSLPDTVQREVLTRRYIFRQKWEEIAVGMNFSARYIQQIHGAALKILSGNS